MSLREDFDQIMWDKESFKVGDYTYHLLLNKVLDAAIGAAPNGINGGDYDENDYAGGWNQGTQEFIEAIQALKSPETGEETGPVGYGND